MKSRYLNSLLLTLLGDINLVERWWTTPNRAFNLRRPCDAAESEVKRYLEGHCFGQ